MFRTAYPTVSIRIIRGAFRLGDSLLRGDVELAVLPDVALPAGVDCNHIATVDLVAVAACGHPLAAVEGPITTDMLREELQIVLADMREDEVTRDWGVPALDSWRVTDLATKHGLLLRGIGWGSMPAPLVARHIAEGRLVVLPIERWDGSDHFPRFSIVAACLQERPLGQAGAALMQMLTDSAVKFS